jgi:hypothetical protein
MIQIPPYQIGVLVGLILSDAWLQFAAPPSGGPVRPERPYRSATNKNARLGFKQGMINFPYLWYVFTPYGDFMSS